MTNLKAQADERLDHALRAAGLCDPRQPRRAQLRRLKEAAPVAFADAIRHYEDVLLPRVAGEDSDPIAEWLDYGLLLVRLNGEPGVVLCIDRTGRARPYEAPLEPAEPVLHVPDDPRQPVTLLSAPLEPSPAQHASIDLLVGGKLELAETQKR